LFVKALVKNIFTEILYQDSEGQEFFSK